MGRKTRRSLNTKRIRNKLQQQLNNERKLLNDTFNGFTAGTVVNTDDPQQMGRLQIFCPALGDISDHPIKDLPWAMYVSPFGGSTSYGTRGPNGDSVTGSTSYGMWAIPKFGAQVLVGTLDGNPDYRIWVGCLYGQYLPHTLPHGRYFNEKDDGGILNNNLEGPLASNEQTIEPLYSNFEEAFGTKEGNHEWQSRGMDNQTSNVDDQRIKETATDVIDDRTRGYSNDKQLPEYGGKDSSVYSITSPGFHSLSMDDKKENCRVKLRTTSGHMILMDDTNERIYISTAKGENWIELDQAGNIDMYTSGNFSVHAEKDINFVSDKSIKMYAKESIDLKSEGTVKIQTDADLHLKSNKNINIKSLENMDTHVVGNYMLQADGTTEILSGSTLRLNTNDTFYTRSTLNTFINGSQTFLNSAASNNVITPYSGQFVETAYIPSKVPEHEPWGRIATKPGKAGNESLYDTNTLIGLGARIDSEVLELNYTDDNVGKFERGIDITRGDNWKR